MACAKVVATLCLASVAFCTPGRQQNETPAPDWSVKFEAYKVREVYRGKPAPVHIVTPTEKMFRTRISEGAKKGPNFAGHYTLVSWGCGSGCVSFVVVNAISGQAHDAAPFSSLFIPFMGTESGREYQGLVYKPDSRLLIADGCEEKCGTYYYEWRKLKFTLLRFEPVGPSMPQ